MLVLIEAHIRNKMHSSQAILTCNFARLQLLGKTFPIASPNSAHTFKEWLRDFKEIASLVPHATESADLHTTLTEFVARFPDKHRSDITQQMKIFKSNRKSRTGDCDLSSDDEEASCSAKQLLDYLCHDIHSALRVKDKAAREVTTAEALRLSSASLEKKATPSEMDKLIKQIASLKAQLQAPPAPAAAPEQPAPPRHAAKPRPKNALANYRDFVLTPAMRNCSNCNERHLDRDCPNRPPPEPLRAPATAAGAGTADPPKVRAPRPAAVALRATAPDLPTAAAAQPPPVPVPANDTPAPALTTRRFAPARAPAPALSALRFGIEPTENGWTSPHEMGDADAASDFWAPRASYSRPALSARRASTTLSGLTYSMFAERDLAQPPHVAPATPISPVCALGGSLASLAMRLLCLFIPDPPSQQLNSPPAASADPPPVATAASAVAAATCAASAAATQHANATAVPAAAAASADPPPVSTAASAAAAATCAASAVTTPHASTPFAPPRAPPPPAPPKTPSLRLNSPLCTPPSPQHAPPPSAPPPPS